MAPTALGAELTAYRNELRRLPWRSALDQLPFQESLGDTSDAHDRAGSLSLVARRMKFLDFAAAEVEAPTARFKAGVEQLQAAFDPQPEGGEGRELDPQEVAAFFARAAEMATLEYRISTYYVWARILDDIVRAIDKWFPSATTIGSYSRLVVNLPRKVAERQLASAGAMIALATELAELKDFRDDYVVHIQNPRHGSGFTWDAAGAVKLMVMPRLPRGAELEQQPAYSTPVPALHDLLQNYVQVAILGWLVDNIEKAGGREMRRAADAAALPATE